jgi:hypothetical protein
MTDEGNTSAYGINYGGRMFYDTGHSLFSGKARTKVL